MKKDKIVFWKKIYLIGFCMFTVIMVIHITVETISLCSNPANSAPWYTPLLFTGTIYAITLIVLTLSYSIISRKFNKL